MQAIGLLWDELSQEQRGFAVAVYAIALNLSAKDPVEFCVRSIRDKGCLERAAHLIRQCSSPPLCANSFTCDLQRQRLSQNGLLVVLRRRHARRARELSEDAVRGPCVDWVSSVHTNTLLSATYWTAASVLHSSACKSAHFTPTPCIIVTVCACTTTSTAAQLILWISSRNYKLWSKVLTAASASRCTAISTGRL